jgi:hypothetical protein
MHSPSGTKAKEGEEGNSFCAESTSQEESKVKGAPPNKHMQRAVNDKVLGRGRGCVVLELVLRARVLKRSAAGADVNR